MASLHHTLVQRRVINGHCANTYTRIWERWWGPLRIIRNNIWVKNRYEALLWPPSQPIVQKEIEPGRAATLTNSSCLTSINIEYSERMRCTVQQIIASYSAALAEYCLTHYFTHAIWQRRNLIFKFEIEVSIILRWTVGILSYTVKHIGLANGARIIKRAKR